MTMDGRESETRQRLVARGAVRAGIVLMVFAALAAAPSWALEPALALELEPAAAEVAEDPQETAATAAQNEEPKTTISLYGFAMLDMGYQRKQNDPDWFDVVRPSKLPSFEGEFGGDGHTFAGVRQSRLGVKTATPTKLGELRTTFEFELFGTGVDAGQTTFRLRHAYGELGAFGAGQTWSPFMDIDVFPNSVEYWGPNGMVFFRNVQLRWMPLKGDSFITIALERPGASGDQGDFADRVELQNIKGHFRYPDLSAEFRSGGHEWGYVEIAGIVRHIEWDDVLVDQFDLSGDDFGWGVNLSSNLKLGRHVVRLQGVYGEGIENYMNDAPADVAPRTNFGDPARPIVGELLPVLGIVAFIDFNWSDSVTSSIGYSSVDIDNSTGQADDAFAMGEYALANVLFYPVKNVMCGPEIQWGRRENFRDGFSSDDLRVQFSVKYNFSHEWGGN
jgi:DcaP outer membrane protein